MPAKVLLSMNFYSLYTVTHIAIFMLKFLTSEISPSPASMFSSEKLTSAISLNNGELSSGPILSTICIFSLS